MRKLFALIAVLGMLTIGASKLMAQEDEAAPAAQTEQTTVSIDDEEIESTSMHAAIKQKFIENAHKPSVKNYNRAMKLMGTDRTNTVFIGDQLFTDIWGAKRAGIRNILVKPIHPKEEIQIVLKRYLEKIVLHFYLKEKR